MLAKVISTLGIDMTSMAEQQWAFSAHSLNFIFVQWLRFTQVFVSVPASPFFPLISLLFSDRQLLNKYIVLLVDFDVR